MFKILNFFWILHNLLEFNLILLYILNNIFWRWEEEYPRIA